MRRLILNAVVLGFAAAPVFAEITFAELLSRHGEVVETRSPLPWTMLLVRV